MKIAVFVASAVCLGLFGCLRYAWYGYSVERAVLGCPYSETMDKSADYGGTYDASGMLEGTGSNFDEQCGPELRATSGKLSESEVDLEGSRSIRRLPEGTVYRIVQKVAIYKHGVEAIDSGSGPLRYNIVADNEGNRWFVWAGLNEEDYIRP